MKNPNPPKLARRLEIRRRALGSDNPCCQYCGETSIECLELEHPVTRDQDPLFTRIVCRNCHRKLELGRDVAGLTKNGQHEKEPTEPPKVRDYLLLLAADHEATAASLRRKAAQLDLFKDTGECQ
jgi:5-methylcytosine-specific restriction endonuclease McrA